MAGPFDHLHIKGRTAGTSNELSFDVLDAVRSGDNAKKPRGIFTTPGVASPASLSAVPEVERRKRARRNRTLRLWVISVTVIAVLAVAAGFAGYRLYQDRAEYTGRYDALVARFVDIDKTIVEVDQLMRNPLNSVEEQKREQVLEKFGTVETELDDVVAAANDLAADPAAPIDSSAASAIEAAASARRDMLDAAEGAFKLSEIVNKHVDSATSAWNKVLSGDSAAREATKRVNAAASEDALADARKLTETAIESMTEGRTELERLAAELGITFAPEIAYIDKRLDSLSAGVQTADALLAGDRAAAASANNAYNASDAEAADMARSLGASVGEQVKALYDDEVQRVLDAYAAARSSAATADSVLRG